MSEVKSECDECGQLHSEDDFVDCCEDAMCGRMICKYCKGLENEKTS